MASFRVARRARLFPLTIASGVAVCLILTDHLTFRAVADSSSSSAALSAVGAQARQPSPVTNPGVQRKRILYMEGAPRPEMKFINRAMGDVAEPQLVILQRTRDNKYFRFNVERPDELRNGFPRTTEELFAYRGLILGPIEASAFTSEQHQMIADFVGVRGGGLLVLGGGQSLGEGGWAGTPLAHVLPIIIESTGRRQAPGIVDHLIVTPTAEGVNHPAIRIADTGGRCAAVAGNAPGINGQCCLREAGGHDASQRHGRIRPGADRARHSESRPWKVGGSYHPGFVAVADGAKSAAPGPRKILAEPPRLVG
jgi:hypothetical protein